METLNAAAPTGEAGINFAQLLAAARRRLKPMAIAGGAVAGLALAAAVFWPATYRSTGTILIEQQEIPTEFVRSAVTSYADQRVQTISQRVMTSANLIGIVEKYNLYPGDRDRISREALVDAMRQDINLQMISADVMDPRQGRATKATIAFAISYDNRNPQTAARVANELTTLYLSENIETRKQLASDTASFLKDESERIERRIVELEGKVAAFKTKNGERLPEYAQLNVQMLERSEQEMRDLETRVRSLDQQIVFLDSQLAQIDPTGLVYTENGERVLSARDRLKVLRSQYASALALYNPEHPDVLRLKREIGGLEAQLGGAGEGSNDTARRLSEARGQLAANRERYGADHPDVKRLEREVAGLEEAMRSAPPAPISDRARDAAGADNPAYIQIRSQRTASANERASLQAQVAQVRAKVLDIEGRQALAPDVEREYSALTRDLQNEQAKYAEVRQKQMEAQLVQNLETERKGERFTLIEPPVQPQKPVSPNRAAILLLGIVLAVGAALGAMLLLENIDTRVRDRAHLIQLLTVPPLAVIPYMELPEEHSAQLAVRRKAAYATAGAVVVLLLCVHLFVRPLDLVGLGLLRRFGL
jgi:uncharacterized protein involved in exopolysaccharide biosynthesis